LRCDGIPKDAKGPVIGYSKKFRADCEGFPHTTTQAIIECLVGCMDQNTQPKTIEVKKISEDDLKYKRYGNYSDTPDPI
ncbi:MAG: hypothetical protein ACHQUC_09445, partial [Chlamydiales bacterium]